MRARFASIASLGIMLLVVAVWAGGFAGCKGKRKILPPAPPAPIDLAGPALPPKTPKPLDVSYIPADAVFALVVDSFQLTDSANFQIFNQDVKPRVRQMGFDFDGTEQIVFLGGLGKKLGEYFVGSIQRYKQPVDVDKYLHERSPEWEEVAEGDHKYYRPQEKGVPCVCAATDRVILAANEETLKKMLAVGKDAESPLLTTLRKSDDAAAALGVLEVAPIRPQISAFLAFTKLPAPFDAPPYDGVKKLPGNVDEAILKFELTPYTALNATLIAKDEDGAIATDTFVANVVDKIVDTINEMTSENEGSPESTILSNLFGNINTTLKHSREGAKVELSYGGLTVQNQISLIGPRITSGFRGTWETADIEESKEKLGAIGAALNDYAAAKGTYPAPASYGPDGKPLLSWRVLLLPQLGQQALYDQFHLDEPWDSEHNKKLIPKMPIVYRNPGHAFDGKTQYVLPTGVGTVFEGKDGPKPDVITDDKAKTILAVELFDGRGIEWTKPEDMPLDRADPTPKLTHLAKPYFLAAFADGVARKINAKKNPAVVIMLFSPAGGEDVPDEF